MNRDHFEVAAQGLLLYFKEGNSLFADTVVSEKLGKPPKVIKKIISSYFGKPIEELVPILSPHSIQEKISETQYYQHSYTDFWCPLKFMSISTEELKNFQLNYSFYPTFLGDIIMASTAHGISYIAFYRKKEKALEKLRERFPEADLIEKANHFHRQVLNGFQPKIHLSTPIPLHLKATDFQLKVWKSLSKIPRGGLLSYSALAGNRKDAHAFGNAVGSNPIAYLIPCHRTVRASGEFGEYHWGKARKAALICLESSKTKKESTSFQY